MRRSHFDALRPVCPRCQLTGFDAVELEIAAVYAETDAGIESGIVHCPNDACRQESPIIDGVPIFVPDVRSFLSGSAAQILRRDDLPPDLRSLVGDAVGPGSEFDQTRQHLSIYCWSHYADLDPEEHGEPGALTSLLDVCWPRGIQHDGPALDIGCSVGRSTFEIAGRTNGMALGVDLNFAMLRKAQEVLRTGRLRYDRRRIGLVYDEREFPTELCSADHSDFWACDALNLPFKQGRFGTVLALNLLDCVASPLDLLNAISRTLRENGLAILATPYDWSPAATPVEAWIGGHSQRGPNAGAAESLLRTLLTKRAHPQSIDGLELVDEIESAEWRTRLHDRSMMNYGVHIATIRKS